MQKLGVVTPFSGLLAMSGHDTRQCLSLGIPGGAGGWIGGIATKATPLEVVTLVPAFVGCIGAILSDHAG
jgi:hypothetical protein